MTLTLEQRWLLMTVGGWQIVDALISPGGVQNLMRSSLGGTRLKARPGAPEWMTSFEVRVNRIVSPWRDGPRVTVTAAQINAYARALPADIKAELEEHALARGQHASRGRDWCLCGRPDECLRRHAGDPLYGDRHHPSRREWNDHTSEFRQLDARERELLGKALRLNDIESGQLGLFEVAS